jgi:hypothetical protein
MKIENIIRQEKIDKSIQSQAILYKGELYTYFDSGLTRHVFVNKDRTKVIKILIDKHSVDYNLEEVEIYKNATAEIKAQMTPTTLEYDGFVVEQEFCNPIKFDNREMTIQQIAFATSCRNEVGWSKDGRLLCFDLNEFKKY